MSAIVVFKGQAPESNQNNVTKRFDVPFTSGQFLIYATGSAFAETVGLLDVQVKINNVLLGSAAVFTNEMNSHKALVPFAEVIPLPFGQNFAEMVAAPGTNVDFNDRFTMVVIAV